MKSGRRRRLERVEIPDEHDARVRTWEVVAAAFGGRERTPRRRSLRPALALAAVVAVVAAVASPPGRAVLTSVLEAIGVEAAQPALFSLPPGGRLLAAGEGAAWLVNQDGSSRLLGPYREVSWSPFGRFIVGSTRLNLVALEPDGDIRWKLARRDVSHATWGGTRADTRIAYLSRRELRVVGGDGRGDALLARNVSPVARPAWRPGRQHVLAFAEERGPVRIVDVETRRVLWRIPAAVPPIHIGWSRDARRLLVMSSSAIAVYAPAERRMVDVVRLEGRAVTAAFASGGCAFALVQRFERLGLIKCDVLISDLLGQGGRLNLLGQAVIAQIV